MAITIIDSPCGSGKTYKMMEMIRNNPNNRFIYITPFLDEIDRMRKRLKENNIEMYTPDTRNDKHTKIEGAKILLKHYNTNIASTHALFSRFDDELADLIEQQNLTLILDEVMNVVQELKEPTIILEDIPKLIQSHCIKIDDNTGQVTWIETSAYKGLFSKYAPIFRDGDVFAIKNKNGKYVCYIWTFPIRAFKSFKNVYICTYMFEYQLQKFYYDLYDVKYIKKTLVNHELVDYKQQYMETNNIEIYDGKNNFIGSKSELSIYNVKDDNKNTPFTFSWYNNRTDSTLELVKKIMTTMVKNNFNCKSNDIIWTTFKKYKPVLSNKGYSRGFLPCNSRSTNNYSNRHYVMYMVDVRINPFIKLFFSLHKIKITKFDEDMYALSEMIQFICRSAIRKNEKIYVYVPSERMRNLLRQYVSDGHVKRIDYSKAF